MVVKEVSLVGITQEEEREILNESQVCVLQADVRISGSWLNEKCEMLLTHKRIQHAKALHKMFFLLMPLFVPLFPSDMESNIPF